MKVKLGFENETVHIKYIPMKSSILKCFVVIEPLQTKDDLYADSFCPRNVEI